jgi:hypothetical protein
MVSDMSSSFWTYCQLCQHHLTQKHPQHVTSFLSIFAVLIFIVSFSDIQVCTVMKKLPQWHIQLLSFLYKRNLNEYFYPGWITSSFSTGLTHYHCSENYWFQWLQVVGSWVTIVFWLGVLVCILLLSSLSKPVLESVPLSKESVPLSKESTLLWIRT